MKRLILALISLSLLFSLAACERVPEPRVERAEFPFEIVYEIGGEIKTASDVYVCEYEGAAWNENTGKQRQWRGYVKSTGKDYVVLLEDGDLKFACKIGSAAYYMGEPSMANAEKFTPSIYYIRTFASGGVSSGFTGIEPMLEEYQLKLVSWKLPEPIENSFE
jgi:hypothetical protein